MPTRRQFISTSAGTALTPALASSNPADEPIFSFGLMADCQYADSKPRGSRFYQKSPAKLKAAVDELNRHELAFSFHVGDFIDRDFASFDVLTPITSQLRAKLYHALGNHDFDVEDEKKADVPARLGLTKGYYSIHKQGFRLIVLDTTEVSPYRHLSGSAENKAAEAELQQLKKQGHPGAKPWNGRSSDEQITWLTSELEAATASDEQALIFGHHPILPTEGHVVWNSESMNQLLQAHACAKVYINGHNHSGHYHDTKGLHYLTLDGILETPDTNAFAIARVYTDRLEIEGHGRQESHVLNYRS